MVQSPNIVNIDVHRQHIISDQEAEGADGDSAEEAELGLSARTGEAPHSSTPVITHFVMFAAGHTGGV